MHLPDGICLDAEGAVWVASPWGDVGIPRVLEGGDFTDQVKIETQSIAVALRRPDRHTLFTCTSILDEDCERITRE